jgi:hypothetical protein
VTDFIPEETRKAVYKNGFEQRRLGWEKRKKVSFMADESQVDGFAEVFEHWIARWGKSKAVDCLIAAICDAESRYQDLRELVAERRKKKK